MIANRKWFVFLLAILLSVEGVISGIGVGSRVAEAAANGPLLVTMSPSNKAASVPLYSKLVMTFDESVKKTDGAATIYIRRLYDNQLFESYTVASDSRVEINSASRNIVTISPSKSFELNTSYYVIIEAGAFANESNGNIYAGLSNAATWGFTTIASTDTTAPKLQILGPGRGATSVAIDTPLKMTFDKAVYVASGAITIRNTTPGKTGDIQTIPVTSTAITGSGSTEISIKPPTMLQDGSRYEVTVPYGALQDASGNIYSGITSSDGWYFTTGGPPLGVPTATPFNNATAVPVGTQLTLTFPTDIVIGTGNIIVKRISDNSVIQTISVSSYYVNLKNNREVTITPYSSLPANTDLYVLIDSGAFKSASNSNLLYEGITSASDWSFTTDPGNDGTLPTLIERSPVNGGVQAATTVELEMKFSKPVFPGSGDIVIRTLTGDSIAATIPVTSDKVSGGGTNTIKVKPGVTLINNTTYYVQISSKGFRDTKGNYYSGISGTDTSSWRFTISQDTVKPTILFTTPVNNGTDVALKDAVLSATFSKQIQMGSGTVTVKKLKGTTGNTGAVATELSIDPQNNQRLLAKITGTLESNTDYYVEMTPGVVKDMAGNAFDGILNQYQWTFRSINTAGGVPTLSKAEMVGTAQMMLTFNRALNPESVPVPANFYVTVNGVSRAISAVEINGSTVLLKLQIEVASGQIVKLSYSPGTRPIEDLTGKSAVAFANRDVTNNPDTTPPRVISGTVSGSIINLVFNKDLAKLSDGAYKQFSLYSDGANRVVTQASGSGSTIMLTMSSPVTTGQNVYVSYNANQYPLKDLSGTNVPEFYSLRMQNGADTQVPVIQSADVSGSTLTLTYNKALNTAQVPPTSAFSVMVNSRSRSVSSVTVTGVQVKLQLSSAVISGDSVVVSYTGGSKPIVDYSGNAAASFSNRQVNGTSTNTFIIGAVVRANTMTLSFSSALNTSYVPSSTQFAVKVNGVSRAVSAVSISGTNVTLTLSTPIGSGDTVQVSYSNSGTGLRSTTGEIASAFTEYLVNNLTAWTDNTNGDFETAASGGLNIKASAATTSSDNSPGGRTTRRYTLSSDKVSAAFQAVSSTSGMTVRVVFTVPESESAGIVAFPIDALQEARRKWPNGSVAVIYRDTSFEIPFSSVDFQQLAQSLNVGLSSSFLLLQIDTSAASMSSQLTAAINSSRSQQLVSTVNFAAAITSSGGTPKPITSFGGYVKRSVSTAVAVDPGTTATVWYDSQASKLSYAPTSIETRNGKSIMTFQSRETGAFAVVKGAASFTDTAKHWANYEILLLSNKFITEGRAANLFDPKSPVTRGEFAMFIVRGLGLAGDKQAATKFKDVAASSPLAAYIGAASSAGIVKGMTDGTFKPNNPITREEITSMMVRAAEVGGKPINAVSSPSSMLSQFPDNKKIGNWAQGDVARAVQVGIINGMSNGNFGAKENASRAEAAVMIKRMLDYIGFIAG